MPPKKTETETKGAAAPKAKTSSHASYQVMPLSQTPLLAFAYKRVAYQLLTRRIGYDH